MRTLSFQTAKVAWKTSSWSARERGSRHQEPHTITREKGETVPDFAFLNENGKPIHIKDYLGKTLLVTFIYTRCPLPDYCPRMNENFQQIQAILREHSGTLKKASFLSISFDPAHDTPAVLKHYASIYNHATPTGQLADWQFAVPGEGPADRLFFWPCLSTQERANRSFAQHDTDRAYRED